MLRESGSGQETSEVSGGFLRKKRISLTSRNTSSLVIDRLCDQAREDDLVVAWLYCDYNAQQDQTVINIMGAILKRVVGSEIPEDIRKAFQEGRRPLFADLMRMLRIAIASLPQVFICIDALDECIPKDLPELLKSLRDIVQESPKTRIFFTGSPHVGEDIQRCFPMAVAIPVSPNQGDNLGQVDRKDSRAVEHGYEGIVKMLLKRGDVHLDQRDTDDNWVLLMLAAEGRNEGIVKRLLERGGVNPDQADTGYPTETKQCKI